MKILQINSSARHRSPRIPRASPIASLRVCAMRIPRPTLSVRDLGSAPHPELDEARLARSSRRRKTARRSKRRAWRSTTR